MDSEQPSVDALVAGEVLTAFHEAGHAVMALSLGRDVHRVSILPNRSRLGQCELKKTSNRVPTDLLEVEVLILLAGAAAEGRVSGGYCWDSASKDLREAQKLIQSRARSVRQAERLERRWLDKVEYLLDSPACWLAIEMLAEDLVERKTISGRSARYHYGQAMARIAKQQKK